MQKALITGFITLIILFFATVIYMLFSNTNPTPPSKKQHRSTPPENYILTPEQNKTANEPIEKETLTTNQQPAPSKNTDRNESRNTEAIPQNDAEKSILIPKSENHTNDFTIKTTDSAHRPFQAKKITVYDIFTHQSENLKTEPNGTINSDKFNQTDQYYFIMIEDPFYETKIGFINFSKTSNLLITLNPINLKERMFHLKHKLRGYSISFYLLATFSKYSHFIHPKITHENQKFLFDLIYDSLPIQAKKETVRKTADRYSQLTTAEHEGPLYYQILSNNFSTNILPYYTYKEITDIAYSRQESIIFSVEDLHNAQNIDTGKVFANYAFKKDTAYELKSKNKSQLLMSSKQAIEELINDSLYFQIPGYKTAVQRYDINQDQVTLYATEANKLSLHFKNLKKHGLAESFTILKSMYQTKLVRNIENKFQHFEDMQGKVDLYAWSNDFKDLLQTFSLPTYSGQTLNKKFPADFLSTTGPSCTVKLSIDATPLANQPVKIIEENATYSLETDNLGLLHFYEPPAATFKISLDLFSRDKQRQNIQVRVKAEDFVNNQTEISFQQTRSIEIQNLTRKYNLKGWSLISRDGSITINSNDISNKIEYYTHVKTECIFLLNHQNKSPELIADAAIIGQKNLTFDANELKTTQIVSIPIKIDTQEEIENGLAKVFNNFQTKKIQIEKQFELQLQSNSYNEITLQATNFCTKTFIMIPNENREQELRIIQLDKSNSVEITSLATQHWNIISNFQVGDLILFYNNEPTKNVMQFKTLEKQHQSSKKIILTIKRNNTLLDIEIPFTKILNLANHK